MAVRATKKQAEGLRLKVEPVRDTDGKIIHGEWVVPCRTGAILYPYDTHAWAADLLSTYWHNRLIKDFGKDMRHFEWAAEIATGCGAGDEHTLHFEAGLLPEVAQTLKARRKRRVGQAQRDAARVRMLELHRQGRLTPAVR